MSHTRILPPKPAMMLDGQKKSMIVSDMHIGFESELAANSVFLGKNSTINSTVLELTEMIRVQKPKDLILLGDVKSSIRSITRQEWNDVPFFFESIQKLCEIVLIPGNHDANIQRLVPDGVTMISPAGMIEEDILLTHGHTMPSENFAHVNRIIMGHVHPVFFEEGSVLNGQQVWVLMKVDKQDVFPGRYGSLTITVMPSFNRYFHATHKKRYRKSISPIIERVKDRASAVVTTLDGIPIGDESVLGHVF